MTSIRFHDGEIRLCGSCGQPCYRDGQGWSHFDEQWDGIHCPSYPVAGHTIAVDWDEISLDSLKQRYPDTHPNHRSPNGS